MTALSLDAAPRPRAVMARRIRWPADAAAWQFTARIPERAGRREQRLRRIIALPFFALAAYVTADSAAAGDTAITTGPACEPGCACCS